MVKEINTRTTRTTSLNKRDRILVEATRQFNEQGYHDTRLEDIAGTFGVGKTSISYHFKSKEALLAAAYRNACDFAESELKVASTARNGLERVMAYIRSHLQAHANILSGEQTSLALLNDFSGLASNDLGIIGGRYRMHVDGFKAFLREGVDDGSVSVQSVEASTFFAFNVMHYIPDWLEAVPERSRDNAIDGFCELMRGGLNGLSEAPIIPSISRNNVNAVPAIFDRETRNGLKRDAFLRTGIRFLNGTGYRNLSLDDIASELGVTRGAFYYHIADKETLLIESFERTCSLIEESLELVAKRGYGVGLIELIAAMRWLFENHLTELDPLLRLNLIHMLDKAPRAVIYARLRKLRALFAELIAQGMIDGSIRTIDLEAAEHIVFGAIFAVSGRRIAATHLMDNWRPQDEPITASASYFEPLITGFQA